MVDSSSDRDPVEALADEFMSRKRAGQHPSIDAYADAHPELAEEIHDLFPTLLMMEECKPTTDSSADSSETASEDAVLTVDRLGDFQILREIGRGGMGVVYEAEQLSLGRHVALKVLSRHMLIADLQIRRFQREARAAARLHHTNIVPVFGVGQEQGYHFYVMQFIRGHGLDEVLEELKQLKKRQEPQQDTDSGKEPRESRQDGSIDALTRSLMTGTFSRGPADVISDDSDHDAKKNAGLEETVQRGRDATPEIVSPPKSDAKSTDNVDTNDLSDSNTLLGHSVTSTDRSEHQVSYWASIARIGMQVADALQHAHDQGIVHRDIKPSNLLLDTRGTVGVTDFGLAKAEDQQDLTHSGDIVGTLRYMAPENLEGKTEARSDIYSLGLTLYELAALCPAFSSSTRHSLIREIMASEPPPLARANSSVPRDLATVIHKAIEREPQHRYATAQDLADDLQRVLEDRPVRARRITAVERFARWSRRNKALAASLLATGALLLLMAIGGTVLAVHESGLVEKTQRLADLVQRSSVEAQNLAEELTKDAYAKCMVLAGQALERPNGGVAVNRNLDRWRLATAAETDRRGWEWHYVASANQANRAVVFDITATDFDWHPNGEWLAFSGCDGIVRVWRGGAKENVIRLIGHSGPVKSVQWSPDGKMLATAGLDGRLLVWKTEDWSCGHSLSGQRRIAWSPTADLLAVVDGDAVRLWNVSTGLEEQSFQVAWTAHLSWNPNGTRLAFSDGRHKVRTWNVVSRKEKDVISVEKEIRQIEWKKVDELIIAMCQDYVCELQMFKAGKLLRSQLVSGHMGPFEQVELSSVSGMWAISTYETFSNARNCAVILFDTQESLSRLLVGHRTPCTLLAWHPAGRLLATSGRDRTVRVWDTQTLAQLKVFRLAGSGGTMSWNSQGTKLASASTQLEVLDMDEIERCKRLPPNTSSFSISPDGQHIALGELGNTVRFWDMSAKAEMPNQALSLGQPVWRLTYSPDGTLLAVAVGDGRSIVIWDLRSRKVSGKYTGNWLLQHGGRETWCWLSWSPDSMRLAAAGGGSGGIHILNTVGKLAGFVRCNRGYFASCQTHLAWSPCGSKIISLPGHNYAELLDARNPTHIVRLKGHEQWERRTSWLWHAAFSPDGKQVVTSSLMGTLRIWDVATGNPVRTLISQEAEGADVSWSPDGHRIASGDSDGGLKIWDAASGRELLSARIGQGAINQLAWTPDGSRIIANVYGEKYLQILDANPSYQREHVPAGLARLDMELQWRPADLQNLIRRAEINLRQGNWQAVLSDVARVKKNLAKADGTDWSRFAERAALLAALANAQLGSRAKARESRSTADKLLAASRREHEVILPQTVRAFADATTPFAWNVAARRELQSFGDGNVKHAVAWAERAVQAVPDCGQFHVTLGVARYRNGEYQKARVAFRQALDLFDGHEKQIDRRNIANIRMRLFRATGDMNPDPNATAEYIIDELVLESLGFLTPDVRAAIPLDAMTIAALDRYLGWFQPATKARVRMYLAMAECRRGDRALAKEACDTAESILKVCPDIDNETLSVWAEAALLIQCAPAGK